MRCFITTFGIYHWLEYVVIRLIASSAQLRSICQMWHAAKIEFAKKLIQYLHFYNVTWYWYGLINSKLLPTDEKYSGIQISNKILFKVVLSCNIYGTHYLKLLFGIVSAMNKCQLRVFCSYLPTSSIRILYVSPCWSSLAFTTPNRFLFGTKMSVGPHSSI